VADREQQTAAWEMYVELVTRISLEGLSADSGLLREALSSLHELFVETRRILRAHGPRVAKPEKKRLLSFGAVAVDVLNVWLRPFLAKWHPRLLDHEQVRASAVPVHQHERAWREAPTMRAELEALQRKLMSYADLLATACEIPSLHAKPDPG
jgi:hypothetical protein